MIASVTAHGTMNYEGRSGGISMLLSFATANVRTLEPAELRLAHRAGLVTNYKIERLDEAFHDAGLQAICLQETSLRSSTTRRQRHYTSYSTAANDEGRLGVAIWIANDLLLRCRVKVVPVSPRL
eukprot:3238521-Heterocapsa_arctica.AAC.1